MCVCVCVLFSPTHAAELWMRNIIWFMGDFLKILTELGTHTHTHITNLIWRETQQLNNNGEKIGEKKENTKRKRASKQAKRTVCDTLEMTTLWQMHILKSLQLVQERLVIVNDDEPQTIYKLFHPTARFTEGKQCPWNGIEPNLECYANKAIEQ